MHRYYPCVRHCETFIIKYSVWDANREWKSVHPHANAGCHVRAKLCCLISNFPQVVRVFNDSIPSSPKQMKFARVASLTALFPGQAGTSLVMAAFDAAFMCPRSWEGRTLKLQGGLFTVTLRLIYIHGSLITPRSRQLHALPVMCPSAHAYSGDLECGSGSDLSLCSPL